MKLTKSFAVLLALILALSTAAYAVQGFHDVPEDAYYREAVKWASEQGIASGVSATRFAPNSSATRAEVAVMIWRFCRAQGRFQ